MIFGIIWAIAILGIVLNSIDIKKFRVFSMICYLAMGWCIIVKANLLPQLLGAKRSDFVSFWRNSIYSRSNIIWIW